MDSGHVDPEHRDRLGPDRPDDLVELGGERVEGPANPIVVQQLSLDAEHLRHRPLRRPVGDPYQRLR
jgi:hypothetical protein